MPSFPRYRDPAALRGETTKEETTVKKFTSIQPGTGTPVEGEPIRASLNPHRELTPGEVAVRERVWKRATQETGGINLTQAEVRLLHGSILQTGRELSYLRGELERAEALLEAVRKLNEARPVALRGDQAKLALALALSRHAESGWTSSQLDSLIAELALDLFGENGRHVDSSDADLLKHEAYAEYRRG